MSNRKPTKTERDALEVAAQAERELYQTELHTLGGVEARRRRDEREAAASSGSEKA